IRTPGLVSYKTRGSLPPPIRPSMKCEPAAELMLTGTVEVDETYVGGKPRPPQGQKYAKSKGRGTKKTPVVVLVQRDGNAMSAPIQRCDQVTLKWAIRKNVDKSATI